MTDEGEFIEYMQIQASTDLVTKGELLQAVRERGLSISERTLTFYVTKGIIPKAARIGTRTGVYPKIVVELLALALMNKKRGVSVEATRQLIPLFKDVARGAITGELDLAGIEYVARQHVTMTDANLSVPFMVAQILSYLCPRDHEAILWRLKDGKEVRQGRDDRFDVSFVLGEQDSEGAAHAIAWIQLCLPGFERPDLLDSRTIILGVPVGVPVEPLPEIEGLPSAAAASSRQEASNH